MDSITKIIGSLENAWSRLQADHPDLPNAVILAAPTYQEGLLGHFGADRWANTVGHLHEVMITGESLNRTPRQIMCTLIHEGAHAINQARGVRDCSSHQYHNKHFRRAAEELGLAVSQVPNRGWAATVITDETAERYAAEIKDLEQVLKLYRRSAGRTTKTKQPTRMLKATCACGHIIRMSRTVFEATGILCDTCGEHFEIN
jgi:hypothetical protein